MKVNQFPHISNVANLEESEKFLDNVVYWTVKLDGSNAGCYIDKDEHPRVCSRNCACANFESKVLAIEYVPNVYNMISDLEFETGHKYIVYGEYCAVGKSPTGLKTYTEDSYTVFAIYDISLDKYLHYYDIRELCSSYDIPIVPLVCVTKSKNLQQFYTNCQIALDVVDTNKKGLSLWFIRKIRHYNPNEEQEGVVGCVYKDDGVLFVKNKFVREPKRKVKREDVVKPVLPRNIIREKVWNVYVEMGDDFFEVKKAMPRIAEVVNEEARQTDSIYIDNIFNVYQEVLCDIQEVRNDII